MRQRLKKVARGFLSLKGGESQLALRLASRIPLPAKSPPPLAERAGAGGLIASALLSASRAELPPAVYLMRLEARAALPATARGSGFEIIF